MKKKLLMLLLAFLSVTACFAQSEKGLWGWKLENGGDGWDYNKIPDAQINDVQDESDFMNLILPYRKYGSDINEIQEDLNTFGNGYYLYELTDNLRIRESDSLESKVLLTLAKGSTVFVYEASRKDIIDGIESNWVNIWTVDAYDKNGNPVPSDTRGWCFGGYLKKLRPWLPQ